MSCFKARNDQSFVIRKGHKRPNEKAVEYTKGKAGMADSPMNATWFPRVLAERNADTVSIGNGDIGKPVDYRTALEQYINEKQGVIDFLEEQIAALAATKG